MVIYKYSQLEKRMGYEEMKRDQSCYTLKGIHLGQLKLLMSEIMFLSKYAKDNNKVLYVGAASGYHITKLVDMFPTLTYDLWDPGKFDIQERKQIKKFNKFFTNKEANKYKNQGRNILFISDIRNLEIASWKGVSIKKSDEIINSDNEKQLQWVRIINPIEAFLKFRPPYLPGKTEYLDGKIYLQSYSPLSTETRLMTGDYRKMKEYDNVEFDEKLAYFNCAIRRESDDTRWKAILKKYKIKNIWDNIIGFYILDYYLGKYKNQEHTDDDVAKLFNEIIKFLRDKYGKKYDIIYEK